MTQDPPFGATPQHKWLDKLKTYSDEDEKYSDKKFFQISKKRTADTGVHTEKQLITLMHL